MAKKKESEVREYDTVATDIVFDENKRVYYLITVGYDFKSKESSVLKKEVLADSKALALHRAKEMLIRKMFGIE